jgi:hypothetical protein
MKCAHILSGVQTSRGERSYFVIEPHNLDQVFEAFGEYKVEADDMRTLFSWAAGEEKAHLLLVSLDLKFATLRKEEKEGKPLVLIGEALLPLYKWPVHGGVEKFQSVLQRDIGPYPVECKRYGLKATRTQKIKGRTNPRRFAEFEPLHFALVREDLSSSNTVSLVWHAMLGRRDDNDKGEKYAAIMKELAYRIDLGRDFQEPEPHLDFYDTSGLSIVEVENRKRRAASYASLVGYLYEIYLETDDLDALELRIAENLKDLDLALEVYIVLLWESYRGREYIDINTNRFRETIKTILWSIICRLT